MTQSPTTHNDQESSVHPAETLTLHAAPAAASSFASVLAEATESKARARLQLLRGIAQLEHSHGPSMHRDPIHIDDLRVAETGPNPMRDLLSALCAGVSPNREAQAEKLRVDAEITALLEEKCDQILDEALPLA